MLARSTPKMTALSKAGQNKISPKAGKKKNSPKVGKKKNRDGSSKGNASLSKSISYTVIIA
jgi:hypothetical protein